MNLCETHIVGRNTREWIVAGDEHKVLLRHHISAAGLSDAAPPYRMLRLKPAHLHILVCTGGGGEVLLGGEWKRCGPRQAYVSPPGSLMGFHAVPRKRWTFAWICYLQPAAARLFPQRDSVLCETESTLFETAIRGLHLEGRGRGNETVAAAWMHLLHTACLRLLKPPARERRLQWLWHEVEENPDHPWSMGQLAARAGMSAEHLRRLSWAETGHSPMRHVASLRLQKAAHLLETSRLKIATVAEAVGYRDAFAFSTAFKRHLGCCPSLYSSRQD